MAATVTIEEVKSMGVTAPDTIINGWIDTATEADACLGGLGLTDNQVKTLKLTFIAWQLDTATSGNVSSQSSKTGASISYKDGAGEKNRFEKAFKSMRGATCLLNVIRQQNQVFLDVMAPSYE